MRQANRPTRMWQGPGLSKTRGIVAPQICTSTDVTLDPEKGAWFREATVDASCLWTWLRSASAGVKSRGPKLLWI